jgi:hypothetical protein
MDQNQPIENALQTPPKKTSRLRTALILAGLVLALLLLKLILILTAKPKVTVDYVQELNRITKPQNYDPNKNAVNLYQKAFDSFVEMPAELRIPYISWPTDYNSTNQALLEKWLISNTLAFEYFKAALNKSYYWMERKAKKDNLVGEITFPESAPFRELTKALIWNAKLSAVKGKFQLAFENILVCYKAGNHKCNPKLLMMEQHLGLRVKKDAAHGAMVILDRTKVESETLKFFQDALQAELDNDDYIPDIQVEKYLLYDVLQRIFIDNGKGTGRLAWRAGFYITPCAELDKLPIQVKWERLKERLYCCFVGPTRKEIVGQVEKVLAMSTQIMAKTPWEAKKERYDCFNEIKNIKKSNWFLEIFGVRHKSIFHSYYETRTQTEALNAILAALRYEIDTVQFAETLNELVSSGYLQAVPNDPYSNSSLVYKLTEDGFKLYSVGKDFSDNGGIVEIEEISLSPLPGEFRTKSSKDIIYWPVKQPEKPKPSKQPPLTGFPPSPYEPNQKDN